MNTVTITVDLSEPEAWQFAEFLKRASLDDYLRNAATENRAYVMRDAGGKIQRALADAGYAPR